MSYVGEKAIQLLDKELLTALDFISEQLGATTFNNWKWQKTPPIFEYRGIRTPELRGVTFIEMGMNWTHIDTRPTTDDELLQLKTWKKFRVLVNRVDTSLAPDIEWLEMTVGI